MNRRPSRVASLIHEELSKLIVEELEFPEMLVTVTSVEVSKKLDHGVVRVSVLPEARAPEALSLLNKERGRLQRELLRAINIKPMPHIEFMIDYGSENAAAVEKALLGK